MKKRILSLLMIAALSLSLLACGSKTVSVELTSSDGVTPMKLITEIQDITELPVKDAKEIVDKAPQIVVEGVTPEEAQEIKARLEAVGGVVTIK